MQIIKKWGSCVVSFVTGVLALVLSACTGMVAKQTIAGVSQTSKTKALKVLTDKNLLEEAKAAGLESEFMTMKVFSIILTVLAVLLIAFAIVMLLKNVNVIKYEGKLLSIVALSLSGLFLVATVAVLVSSNSYAGAMEDVVTKMFEVAGISQMASVSVKVGTYQPVMLATGIVSVIAMTFCEFKNIKEN